MMAQGQGTLPFSWVNTSTAELWEARASPSMAECKFPSGL